MIVEALTLTKSRRGEFNGYAVLGIQYHHASGLDGWHCTAWNSKGSLYDYWVSNGQFYNAAFHYSNYTDGGTNCVEIKDAASDLPPKVVQAINKALYEWEHEEKTPSLVTPPPPVKRVHSSAKRAMR